MDYDLIVIGSGNGACGFLSNYLQTKRNEKILVIEEGDDFFNISDITHQKNWTQSYGEENIFKLHNAVTSEGIPIISGRACAMGGGGSINYTMIHESSEWLAKHIGWDLSYWDKLKAELNQKFQRTNSNLKRSPVTQHIIDVAEKCGFELSNNAVENIPNYQEGSRKRLIPWTSQFNKFGQRTNSGVSLVDWFDERLTLLTRYRVEKLEWETTDSSEAKCIKVQAKNLETEQTEYFSLSEGGKVILACGGATPRLLMGDRELLSNNQIGQQVNDHIVFPLGIYLLDRKIDVTPADVYIPVFATTLWEPKAEQTGSETVCCFDFFSGNFEKLWYLISHLYLAFLLPNWFKKIIIRVPWLFYIIKNTIRMLISFINFLINILWGINRWLSGKSWEHEEYDLVTAIVKFNPATDGYYCPKSKRIFLDFFASDTSNKFNQDKSVAEQVIVEQIEFLNQLGTKPHWFIQWIIRLLTKIPYDSKQVPSYIKAYSRKFLLSEQHLSGGCLFGKAIDKGLENPENTGKVYGTTNVYVADLSAVPLPRISPQMTAYLIGFHVAHQLSQ